MKQAKRDGKMATITRDKLFIDSERSKSINEMVNHPPQTQDRAGKHSVENRDNTGYRDAIMTPNNNQNSGKRPYKPQRAWSSPGNSSAQKYRGEHGSPRSLNDTNCNTCNISDKDISIDNKNVNTMQYK